MDYQHITSHLRELPFVEDDERADALAKAVLGIAVSRMQEPDAREFAADLPEPLDFERLRSHQAKPSPTPADLVFAVLANQFPGLTEHQAAQAVECILRDVKQGLPAERVQQLYDHLPADWQSLLDAA